MSATVSFSSDGAAMWMYRFWKSYSWALEPTSLPPTNKPSKKLYYQLGFCSMPLSSISLEGIGNNSCLPFWNVP